MRVIFVMAGTERFPFARLLQGVEEALRHRRVRGPAFAQVGHSTFLPALYPWARFLSFDQVVRRIGEARIVVCHAGAGSVLLCRELGKVPVVMPRRAALGEHVDDHQLEFAQEAQRAGIALVVHTAADLDDALVHHEQRAAGLTGAGLGPGKRALIEHLRRLYGAASAAPR